MTYSSRSQSANDRLKASYDQIVAASLVRAAMLHFAVFHISPVVATVAIDSRVRSEIVLERLEEVECGWPEVRARSISSPSPVSGLLEGDSR